MARAISKIVFILGSYNFLAYLLCVRSYAWSKGHSDPDLSSVYHPHCPPTNRVAPATTAQRCNACFWCIFYSELTIASRQWSSNTRLYLAHRANTQWVVSSKIRHSKIYNMVGCWVKDEQVTNQASDSKYTNFLVNAIFGSGKKLC